MYITRYNVLHPVVIIYANIIWPWPRLSTQTFDTTQIIFQYPLFTNIIHISIFYLSVHMYSNSNCYFTYVQILFCKNVFVYFTYFTDIIFIHFVCFFILFLLPSFIAAAISLELFLFFFLFLFVLFRCTRTCVSFHTHTSCSTAQNKRTYVTHFHCKLFFFFLFLFYLLRELVFFFY